MYLITTSLYPPDKVKEAANMYVQMMTKYPDNASFGTPIVQGAVRSTIQGMKVISIFDVKKGKFDDAMALTVERMTMFNDIPGYRWVIKPYYNLEEAFKTIGM
jgi:hypothetical protein